MRRITEVHQSQAIGLLPRHIKPRGMDGTCRAKDVVLCVEPQGLGDQVPSMGRSLLRMVEFAYRRNSGFRQGGGRNRGSQ